LPWRQPDTSGSAIIVAYTGAWSWLRANFPHHVASGPVPGHSATPGATVPDKERYVRTTTPGETEERSQRVIPDPDKGLTGSQKQVDPDELPSVKGQSAPPDDDD
jgi:hypothetical protein